MYQFVQRSGGAPLLLNDQLGGQGVDESAGRSGPQVTEKIFQSRSGDLVIPLGDLDPGVSQPVQDGGLGFSYKWNMGWMHDTLRYMEHDSIHRPWHHNDMTFGLLYAFFERFVLPL